MHVSLKALLELLPREPAPALSKQELQDFFERSTGSVTPFPERRGRAPGETVLGRDRLAPGRIDDVTVSRRHARISVTGKTAVIQDLGSKNGTFLNGKRVAAKPLKLSDGDEIQLGSVFLAFRAASSEKSTETIRAPRRT